MKRRRPSSAMCWTVSVLRPGRAAVDRSSLPRGMLPQRFALHPVVVWCLKLKCCPKPCSFCSPGGLGPRSRSRPAAAEERAGAAAVRWAGGSSLVLSMGRHMRGVVCGRGSVAGFQGCSAMLRSVRSVAGVAQRRCNTCTSNVHAPAVQAPAHHFCLPTSATGWSCWARSLAWMQQG